MIFYNLFNFSFIIGVVALILVLGVRSRVKRLEEIIKNGTVPQKPEENYQSQIPRPEMPYREGGLPTLPQAQAFPASVATESSVMDRFTTWLSKDWLLKLGAVLLLIGFGWLTTYAFLNNWIGPGGRITLGIVAGALFLALGWWRMQKFVAQGGVFLVLGSTTILLTTFAARSIYGFFTPFSALAIMFLSTVFVAVASVVYKSRNLSLASIILAGIAPLLTSGTPNDIGLFSYLLVVILGTVWLVALTGQRALTVAGLIIFMLYSLPNMNGMASSCYTYPCPSITHGTLLLFAYAFAAVFFLTNTIGIVKAKVGDSIKADLVSAGGNGLLLLAWIMTNAPTDWRSLIISAWMVIFVVGAFMTFNITKRREPFLIYAGVSVAMLAAATFSELHMNTAALTVAYTIESGIIALLVYLILRNVQMAQRTSWLLVGPAILSISSLTSFAWSSGVIHQDFFVIFFLALNMMGLGLFFLNRARAAGGDVQKTYNPTLLVAGSIYTYALIWLSLHAGSSTNQGTATMISLVIYTIIGITCYYKALSADQKGLRRYGGALLGFVVGRLLLIDIWKMPMSGRIVTFFLIGALLISTAFLGKRKLNSNH